MHKNLCKPHPATAFTLARIAGHFSITITERYCLPQAEAIERAFAEMAQSEEEVTRGRHCEIPAQNS